MARKLVGIRQGREIPAGNRTLWKLAAIYDTQRINDIYGGKIQSNWKIKNIYS